MTGQQGKSKAHDQKSNHVASILCNRKFALRQFFPSSPERRRWAKTVLIGLIA